MSTAPTLNLKPAIDILTEAMADADQRIDSFTTVLEDESNPHITEKMRRDYLRLREAAATERTACAEAISLLEEAAK